MKNNKGFIAISLIYSFFLVFLMTLLSIVVDYAHNRILLNDVKKTTQEKLNGLSEFNPIHLENKTYAVGEVVSYADDKWIVIKNNSTSAILMLERSLKNSEMLSALDVSISSAVSGNTISMCYNGYTASVCSYESETVGRSVPYYWDDSIVKIVVDDWLLNNALLQKAIANNALINMSFSDGRQTNSSYIRIPLNNEYTATGLSIWNLTYSREDGKQSVIKINNVEKYAHSTNLEVKPVIHVYKST